MATYNGTNDSEIINVTTTYDQYNGLGGDDVFVLKSFTGTVTLNGGAGIDTLRLATSTQFAFLNIGAGASIEVLDFNGYMLRGNADANIFDLGGVTGYLNTEWINLGAGNDTLTGSLTDDYVEGGDGNDTLQGGAGNDVLSGDAGDDTLVGGDGDDTFQIYGTLGNESFDGGAGSDQIMLTGTVYAQNFAVTTANLVEILDFNGYSLNGTSGADSFDLRGISSFVDQRTIDLGAGGDTFTGSALADNVYGGDGDDVLNGEAGDDHLNGGLGNDELHGGAGDDFLEINGVPGTDLYDGGAGLDRVILSGSVTANIFTINAASSVEIFDFNSYYFSGTTGADRIDLSGISAFANQRTIDLGDGNDSFVGSKTADDVYGGNGNDTLKGGTGDDFLAGGAGDDKLYGQDGDDTFLINGVSGADTFSGGNGFDRVRLTGTVTAQKLTIGTTASVEVLDFGNYYLNGTTGGDRFDLSGVASFYNQRTIDLGAGNDVFIGSAIGDDVAGGEGADTLKGGAGDDVLAGGLGNDQLFGEAGNDTFVINGTPGADTFNGGDGMDRIYLSGSVSAQSFTVGTADSVEIFDFGNYYFSGTTQADTVDLSGIQSFSNQRTIDLGNGNDTFIGSATNDDVYGGDGVDTLNGGLGNDILNGGAGNDTLNGGAGDDILVINGNPGADVFNGGDGLDRVRLSASVSAQSLTIGVDASVELLDFGSYYLSGTTGNDVFDISGITGFVNQRTIDLGNGDDQFIGSAIADDVDGGDGADTLNGGLGNDILDGGAGNDTLIGGDGNDTFLISGAPGVDTFNGGAGADKLRLAASAEVSSLTLGTAASVETIDFASYSLNGTSGNDRFDIRGVTAFINQRQIDLGAGNDVFIGSAAADNVQGGAGDDNLKGGSGQDRLYGGAGADTLSGGADNDSFYFTAGQAGGDKVVDFNGAGAGVGDMLYFSGYGSGATFEQVDATHWRVSSSNGSISDLIEFTNGASIHSSDFVFV
ncbi:beta strand repeat-containing protein [Zavarzinia aquatilis]|uniref:Calcium-binding protein n=1 Tax=Zavarzinia aquatilis TaxID=2211142 RepID=A0A317E9K6_9PROT|nr:calcium-binding protein [Zavarzinia aquatilis]PWR22964.1 hypothetical protein DKG74_11175 [Zavarzinia aquatilis]